MLPADPPGLRQDQANPRLEYAPLSPSQLSQTFLLKEKRWLRADTKEVPVKADGASKVPPIPKNGTLRFPVPNPVFVTEGTWPKGSMWARDPVSSREARHPISRL